MLSYDDQGGLVVDGTCDASRWGLFAFGLYNADDPRIMATVAALRDKLWVRTPVGGMARYEDDRYQRVSTELPGNPWFIATLWQADHLVMKATCEADLAEAAEILSWVADHALPSGVLAEQVHPFTGKPVFVSPLTWSHGTFVASAQRFIRHMERIKTCPECRLPLTADSRREDWIEKLFSQACDAIHGSCRV
jgi:glucoamylase